MDASQTFAQMNWLAVIVAAISGFPLGALWYGPLFGASWRAETGVTPERSKAAGLPRIFGTVLVVNFIIALSLAMFIGPKADAVFGLMAGFLAGFTFVAMGFAIAYLFELRSFKFWAINAGYQVLLFSVMGVILGAWR